MEYRLENRRNNPDWFNGPVPSFGDIDAQVFILGLAPGVKGANRTGRPFTGDYAGDLLYPTLLSFGFASGEFDARPDDGVQLINCRIANAVRCVPPQNKPVGQEMKACAPFLEAEIAAMDKLRVILALGTIAHNAALGAVGEKRSAWKFGHNIRHDLPNGPILIDSYHCSRYNTNTGRLTESMFHDVFETIRSDVPR
ncbi:MAG: uracil-DNA glycosylase [Alphaproteobacteria bacterium]|nr:uracil-DNA glycosylase [Alphaproteobacteria bacterium]